MQGNAERITIIAEFGRMPEPELTVQAGQIYRFDKRWLDNKRWCYPAVGTCRMGRAAIHLTFSLYLTGRRADGGDDPVLHGLDGRRYCPHLVKEVCLFRRRVQSCTSNPAATGALCKQHPCGWAMFSDKNRHK